MTSLEDPPTQMQNDKNCPAGNSNIENGLILF